MRLAVLLFFCACGGVDDYADRRYCVGEVGSFEKGSDGRCWMCSDAPASDCAHVVAERIDAGEPVEGLDEHCRVWDQLPLCP